MDARDIALTVTVVVIFGIFISAAFGGILAAPFVPTFQRDVRRMLKLARVEPKDYIYDLGSGDGRFLIISATEFGARSRGFEVSWLPFLISWVRIKLRRVSHLVSVECKNFYRQDLSGASVVTCFLTPRAMKKLEAKFANELRSGTRVISYAFKLPSWKPVAVDKPTPTSTPVFLYLVP